MGIHANSRRRLLALGALTLASCGGTGRDIVAKQSLTPATTSTYSIGGTVSGLANGQHVVLQDDQGETLTVGPGPFEFTNRRSGGNFSVVLDQAASDRRCRIENASGSIAQTSIQDIRVRCAGVFAYVVNTFAATVSQYSIGNDGQLGLLAVTTSVLYDNPVHIAVHPNGKYAYVANQSAHTILQYSIANDGRLVPLPVASVWVGFAYSPTRIVVSSSGQFAYALNYSSGDILQFSIDTGGALSPLATALVASGATEASGLVLDDASHSAVVVDRVAHGRLYVLDQDASGSLTPRASYAADIAGTDIVLDAIRRNIYVASRGANSIQHWSIDHAGALGYIGSTSSPAVDALALNTEGTLLWATDWANSSIHPFQVDTTTGEPLALANSIASGGISGPISIGVVPDGRYVFVVNYLADTVSQFLVTGIDGGLTSLTPNSVGTGATPNSIAVY